MAASYLSTWAEVKAYMLLDPPSRPGKARSGYGNISVSEKLNETVRLPQLYFTTQWVLSRVSVRCQSAHGVRIISLQY